MSHATPDTGGLCPDCGGCNDPGCIGSCGVDKCQCSPNISGSRRNALRRMKAIRGGFAQTVRDLEWWNEHRTDAPPFDVGVAKVDFKLADDVVKAMERGDKPAIDAAMKALLKRADHAD